MVDMANFIAPKSDQLNADDLLAGPRIITVTGVRGTDASDQPVAVNFQGDNGKPYKPCKSMRRVMVHCWGRDASTYAGKSMELYCDPDVQFGGMKVGGIRISKMSHIDGPKKMALTAAKGKKGLYEVRPLQAATQSEPQDFSAQLAQLRGLARPGNAPALRAEWDRIGKDARKALANELAALQQACEPAPQTSAGGPVDNDDVSFDPPATNGGNDGYDGA